MLIAPEYGFLVLFQPRMSNDKCCGLFQIQNSYKGKTYLGVASQGVFILMQALTKRLGKHFWTWCNYALGNLSPNVGCPVPPFPLERENQPHNLFGIVSYINRELIL